MKDLMENLNKAKLCFRSTVLLVAMGVHPMAAETPNLIPALLPSDDAPGATLATGTREPARLGEIAPPPLDFFQSIPPSPSMLAPIPGSWISQGAAPIRFGQTENVSPDNEVAGAIHTVVAHPTDPDILYIGAVNGGVWKTTNATAASPTWTPLTDDKGSLSIGALDFDPTDATNATLWAGLDGSAASAALEEVG